MPIYNVEKYLDRCITSIVNQTYQNIEIILVDDGSPDHCPDMCDEWADKDSRIKVIHKKNAGLGMARNTGIEHATGDYICFIDSDDYIALNTIEAAYTQAIKEQAELVVFGCSIVNGKGDITREIVPHIAQQTYRDQQVQAEFLPDLIAKDPSAEIETGLMMSAWVCLFKKEVIDKSAWRFVSERDIVSEDVYSLLNLYKDVQSVTVLSKGLYFYCENNTSLTRTYRKDRYERIKNFYVKCTELCERNGYSEKVKNRCTGPYLSFVIAAMKQEVAANKRSVCMQNIKKIIDDDLLQDVLAKVLTEKNAAEKHLLYKAMQKKRYAICYAFFWLKIKQDILSARRSAT